MAEGLWVTDCDIRLEQAGGCNRQPGGWGMYSVRIHKPPNLSLPTATAEYPAARLRQGPMAYAAAMTTIYREHRRCLLPARVNESPAELAATDQRGPNRRLVEAHPAAGSISPGQATRGAGTIRSQFRAAHHQWPMRRPLWRAWFGASACCLVRAAGFSSGGPPVIWSSGGLRSINWTSTESWGFHCLSDEPHLDRKHAVSSGHGPLARVGCRPSPRGAFKRRLAPPIRLPPAGWCRRGCLGYRVAHQAAADQSAPGHRTWRSATSQGSEDPPRRSPPREATMPPADTPGTPVWFFGADNPAGARTATPD